MRQASERWGGGFLARVNYAGEFYKRRYKVRSGGLFLLGGREGKSRICHFDPFPKTILLQLVVV